MLIENRENLKLSLKIDFQHENFDNFYFEYGVKMQVTWLYIYI